MSLPTAEEMHKQTLDSIHKIQDEKKNEEKNYVNNLVKKELNQVSRLIAHAANIGKFNIKYLMILGDEQYTSNFMKAASNLSGILKEQGYKIDISPSCDYTSFELTINW